MGSPGRTVFWSGGLFLTAHAAGLGASCVSCAPESLCRGFAADLAGFGDGHLLSVGYVSVQGNGCAKG